MTVTFYSISEWFPGSKRPFCSQANMNAFLEQHAVGSQSSNTWWFPNSPQDLEYIDVNGDASTNTANYIIVREMTGSGTRWGYFVTNGRPLTSGVYRMELQYDPYISYIIQRGPTIINVSRAHIAGAHGGGVTGAVPTSIVPTGKMAVTSTQALNLETVLPLSEDVRLVVAFSFEQGPADTTKRNFIFVVAGSFNSGGGLIGAATQAYGANSFYANNDPDDVWSDGVVSGMWYAPASVVSTAGGVQGVLYHTSGDTKVGQNVYAMDPCAFGTYLLSAQLKAANTINHHCRVGNPLRSVEVCPRVWNTPVFFSYAINGEAGVFSFGFVVDNEYVDLTETVALPYAVVQQNSGKTQRQIADTIGLVGSGIGVATTIAAAIPTGGLSLIGTASQVAGFAQQIAEKVNRPTPNSGVPGSGLNSLYAFVSTAEGESKEWTGGLAILGYQAANMPDIEDFGYPQDFWGNFVQLSHTSPSTNTGYYIRIDQGEPTSAPPEYRRGIKEQLAAGVIVYNGVPS